MTRLWPEGEAVETWGPEDTPSGFIWRVPRHPERSVGSCPESFEGRVPQHPERSVGSCPESSEGRVPQHPERSVGTHPIKEATIRWRVHSHWWEPEKAIWREYVKVITDTGLLCLLYRDLIGGGWFLARVYD